MYEKTGAASYGASGVIVWMSALDWNTIALAGGLILGIATFAVNWWYKRQNSLAYRKAIDKGVNVNGPSD